MANIRCRRVELRCRDQATVFHLQDEDYGIYNVVAMMVESERMGEKIGVKLKKGLSIHFDDNDTHKDDNLC